MLLKMWRPVCVVVMVMAGLLHAVEGTSITLRAVDPSANGQKAARFVGLGYNLLTADPDAAGGGGVDPGFLTKRRVVDVAQGGQESFPRHSCVTRTSTSTIYDERSFQKKFDLDVAVEASVSYKVVDAKFGLSTSFSSARDQTTKQRKMTYEKQTLCNLGGARMKTELAVNRASQGFQAAVCGLPDTYEEAAYVNFINTWGTSYVIEVDVGVRNLNKKTETFSSVFESMQSALGVSASASVGYNGAFVSASGSVEMNMNKVENSDKFSESFKGSETTKNIGTETYPEPIFVRVGSLHDLLTSAYFKGTNPSACTQAKLDKLASKQANLKKALEAYPEARNVYINDSTGRVSIPLVWPKGTYGLLKPDAGCPSGWASDGYRQHDTADGSGNINAASPGEHFNAVIGTNIKLTFCVKTRAVTSALNDVNWPVGEYCLYKYRDCPKGFTPGFIYHDDEDDNPQRNSIGGTVPDGEYTRNTKYFFCCRKDGHNNNPIFLPTDKPFYLAQSSRYGCQHVAGMRVRPEYIQWDDEDGSDNTNTQGGTIPYANNGRNWRVNYCYYYQ